MQRDKDNKNLVTINVCEYFDYSIFNKDEKGMIKEYLLSNMKIKNCVIPDNCDTLDKSILYIKSVAKKECISDVILAIIYSFTISEDTYIDAKERFSGMTEENLKIRMLNDLRLVKDMVVVKGAYPIVLREIFTRDSLYTC